MKLSRNIFFLSLSIVFLIPPQVLAGGFYKWVDENGIIHFLDSTSGTPKKHEVPYKTYEGNAKWIIIPVTFNGSVTEPIALDTGAPGLVIPPRLAEKLDFLDTEETNLMIPAGGVGGSFPALRTIMDLVQVGGAKNTFIPIFPPR